MFILLRFLDGFAFIADQFSLKINMCKACTGSSLLKQNKGVVCLNYLIEEPRTILLSLIFHSQFIEILIIKAMM